MSRYMGIAAVLIVCLSKTAAAQLYIHRKTGGQMQPLRIAVGGLALWALAALPFLVPIHHLSHALALSAGVILYAFFTLAGSVRARIAHGALSGALLAATDWAAAALCVAAGIRWTLSKTPIIMVQAQTIAGVLYLYLLYALCLRKEDLRPLLALIAVAPIVNALAIGALMRIGLSDAYPAYPELLFITVASYAANILVLTLYHRCARLSRKVMDQESMLAHDAVEREYIRQVESANYRISSFRHDFLNHVQVILGYLQQHRYEQIKRYLEEISGSLASANVRARTGNPTVDALLGCKLAIAHRQGIDFDYAVAIPEALPLPATDLSCVLGNLLDNALEACQAITDPDAGKSVDLMMDIHEGCLSISVRNTAPHDPARSGRAFTVSRKGKGHGIGLRNIRQIVDKYRGTLALQPGEDMFFALVVLPLVTRADCATRPKDVVAPQM
ncbi:MAG: GHKL domain-containing protein [Clostridiales bacterium]|nr:GHKL domain-containing protein [Clostridiales bacterium]